MQPATIWWPLLLIRSAAVTSALPSNGTCSGTLDTYEDIPQNPVTGVIPTVGGTHIGYYNGLNYGPPFILVDTSDRLLGVEVHGDKAIQTGLLSDLMNDFSLTLIPFGNITSNTSFDLDGFAFGCQLGLDNADAEPAISCTLTVCAFTWANVAVPCESFRFTQASTLLSPLQLAQPSAAYRNLKSVYFGVAQTFLGTLTDERAVLVLDDVCHKNSTLGN